MRAPKPSARAIRLSAVAALALGCNALLENDPRDLGAFDDAAAGNGEWDGESTDASAGGAGGSADEGDLTADAEETGGRSEATSGAGQGGAAGDESSAGAGGSAGDLRPEAGSAGASAAGSSTDAGTMVGDARPADAEADNHPADADAALGPCQLPTRTCTAGAKETGTMACDSCGTGKATRTRTCDETCSWGAWGAYGACVSTEQCTASASETRSVSCSCGGSKGQKRTCSGSCTWGGWADTSSCDIDCCAELVYCDTPDLSGVPASRGTWCRETTAACTNAEVEADCRAILSRVGCTLHQVFYIDYL